jgi:tRNA(Ile)-lysidine synthase
MRTNDALEMTLPRLPANLDEAFAASLDRLGPFEERPTLAIAVSGGADSMTLALLARDWVTHRDGHVHALVVDHGLRVESPVEAAATIEQLAAIGIPATLLTLTALTRGPALAERARIARYEALTAACRAHGWLHLLLGHHAADQAETLAMRVLRQSGSHGLAAMPALSETRDVRLLRPLLAIEPAALRCFLQARGVAWVEDPSNRDRTALRPRLRQRLGGSGSDKLTAAARVAGVVRGREEEAIAVELAAIATLRPEGFVQLPRRRISPGALAALIQTVGGAAYPPNAAQLADLVADLRPATLAGVRVIEAGAGVLLVREEAAMAEPIVACPGARWDGRMRLLSNVPMPDGTTIGALGDQAARFRKCSTLPSVVLRTLPVLRCGKELLAVPHLSYVGEYGPTGVAFCFDPPRPAGRACFRSI